MSKTTTKNKALKLFITICLALGLTLGLFGVSINSLRGISREANAADETVQKVVYKNGSLDSASVIPTKDGYYEVSTAEEFVYLITTVLKSGNNNTLNIRLMDNFEISFADQKNNASFVFQTSKPVMSGITLDGNGKRITFADSVVFTNGGFFSSIDDCTIKNLTFHFNGNIVNEAKANNVTFGSFCDKITKATFTNSNLYFNGIIDLSTDSSPAPTALANIGGLFGEMTDCTFTSCKVETGSSSVINVRVTSKNGNTSTASVINLGGIAAKINGISFDSSTINSAGSIMSSVAIDGYAKDLRAAGIAAIATGAIKYEKCSINVYANIVNETTMTSDADGKNAKYGLIVSNGSMVTGGMFADATSSDLSMTKNKLDLNGAGVTASGYFNNNNDKSAYGGRIAARIGVVSAFETNVYNGTPAKPVVSLKYRGDGNAFGNGQAGALFGEGAAVIGENNWILTSERFEKDGDYWNDTASGYEDDNGSWVPEARPFSGNAAADIAIKNILNRVITYGNAHVDSFIYNGEIYYAPKKYEKVRGNATPFMNWLIGNPSKTSIGPGTILTGNVIDDTIGATLGGDYAGMPVLSPTKAWSTSGGRKSIIALHMFTEIKDAYELTQFGYDTNGGMNYPWVNVHISSSTTDKRMTFNSGLDPIGTMINPFKGTFEGSGKTITFAKGSKIDFQDNVGIFGVNEGKISNFNVIFNGEARLVSGTQNGDAKYNESKNNMGILVGYNKGNISNINLQIGVGVKMITYDIGLSNTQTANNTVFNMGGAIGKNSALGGSGVTTGSVVSNINIVNYANMTVATAKTDNLDAIDTNNNNLPYTLSANYGGAIGYVAGGTNISYITVEFQGSMQTTYRNNFYKMGGFAGKVDASSVDLYGIGVSMGSVSVISSNLTVFNPVSNVNATILKFEWIGNFVGQITNASSMSPRNFYIWISKNKDTSVEQSSGQQITEEMWKYDEVRTSYIFAHDNIKGYASTFTYIKNIGNTDNTSAAISADGAIKDVFVSAPVTNTVTKKFDNITETEYIIRDIAVLSVSIVSNSIKFKNPALQDNYIFTGWFNSALMDTAIGSDSATIGSDASMSPNPNGSIRRIYTRIISNKIFNVADLNAIAHLVNTSSGRMTFAGVELELMEDIFITAGYTPIGNTGEFRGRFNGNGKKIVFDGQSNADSSSKIFVVSGTSAYSLFGVLGTDAKVFNITVEYKNIISSFNKVFAGVAYTNYGTIGGGSNAQPTAVVFDNCQFISASNDLSVISGTTGFAGVVYNNGGSDSNSVYKKGIVSGVEISYNNSKIHTYTNNAQTTNTYFGGAIAINNGDVLGLLVRAEESQFVATGRVNVYLGGVIAYQGSQSGTTVTNIASDIKEPTNGTHALTLKCSTTNSIIFVPRVGMNIGGMADGGTNIVSNSYMIDCGQKYEKFLYDTNKSEVVNLGLFSVNPDGATGSLARSNRISIYAGDDVNNKNVFGTLTILLKGKNIVFTATEHGVNRPFNTWRATQADGKIIDLLPTNGANGKEFTPVNESLHQFVNSNILIYFVKSNIKSIADLRQIANDVALGYNPKIKYYVDNNINVNGEYKTPIGTEAYPFAGEIEGNGNKFIINGVNSKNIIVGGVTKTVCEFEGLFGYLGIYSIINNLEVEVAGDEIVSTSENGFGILAYSNLGIINNVKLLLQTNISVNNKFGGIVAINDKTVVNDRPYIGKLTSVSFIHTAGLVSINSTQNADVRFGYIAAINNAIIGTYKSSATTQDVIVNVKQSDSSELIVAKAAVDVKNSTTAIIKSIVLGGIVGVNNGVIYNSRLRMEEATSISSHEAKRAAHIGGVVGENYGSIINIEISMAKTASLYAYYNSVSSSGESYVGGIVGRGFDKSIIDGIVANLNGTIGAKNGGTDYSAISGGVAGSIEDDATIKNANVILNGSVKAGQVGAGLVGIAGRPIKQMDGLDAINYIFNINLTINAPIESRYFAGGMIGKNSTNVASSTVTINAPIKATASGSVTGGLIADNQIQNPNNLFAIYGYVSNVLLNLNSTLSGTTIGLMTGRSFNNVASNSWVLTMNDTKHKVANTIDGTASMSGFNSMRVVSDKNYVTGNVTNGKVSFTIPNNIRPNVNYFGGWYSNISQGIFIMSSNDGDGYLTDKAEFFNIYYTFSPHSHIANKDFHVSFVKLSIENEQDLINTTTAINASNVFYGVRLQLMNDITISNTLIPIGTREIPFNGVFDGTNKTITFETGLSIAGEKSKGLFGVIGEDGLVQNLLVFVEENVNLFASSSAYYYGMFVGECYGKLNNIIVNSYSSPIVSGGTTAGAFAGKMGEKAVANNVWIVTYNNSLNTTAEGSLIANSNGDAEWSGANGINKLSVLGNANVVTSFYQKQFDENTYIRLNASGDQDQKKRFYKWMSNSITNKELPKDTYGSVESSENIIFAPNANVKNMMFSASFIQLEISTEEDYFNFISNANKYSGLRNTTIRLMNNLVIKDKFVNPIGTLDLPFDGIFDGSCTLGVACKDCKKVGNNHTITFEGVTFNGVNAAMFGYVAIDGQINNLTIKTSANNFDNQNSGDKVAPTYGAGVVGYFDGNAKNLVVLYGEQADNKAMFKNSFAGAFGVNAKTENVWVVIDQFLNMKTVNTDLNNNNSVNSFVYASIKNVTINVDNNATGITFKFKEDGSSSQSAYLSKNNKDFVFQSNYQYKVQLGTSGSAGGEDDRYETNGNDIRINDLGNAIYNELVVLFAKLEISTMQDLYAFAKQINKGINYRGITYVLMNDIYVTKDGFDASNNQYINGGLFTPIGGVVGERYDGQMSYFSGVFDGNGHTISFDKSMSINNINAALFGMIDQEAKIKNLNVQSDAIIGNSNTRHAAILVAESTISGESRADKTQIDNVTIYANPGTKLTAGTMKSYVAAKYDGTVANTWVIATNSKFNEDILVDLAFNDTAKEVAGVNIITILGGGRVNATSATEDESNTPVFTFNTVDETGKNIIKAKSWHNDFAYDQDHLIVANDTNKINGRIELSNGGYILPVVASENRPLIKVRGGADLRIAVDFLTRELSTESDIVSLSDQVNKGYSFYGIEISLSQDIVIDGSVRVDGKTALKPIGTKNAPFTAIFNGNNHSIKLTNNISLANYEYSGFFGYIGEDAVVKNLKLQGDKVYLAGTYNNKGNVVASAYAGLIAFNEGKLQNVIFETYGIKLEADKEISGAMIFGAAIGESTSLDIDNCWSIVKSSNMMDSVHKNKDIRLNQMVVVGRGDIFTEFESVVDGDSKVVGTQIVLKETEIAHRTVVRDAKGVIISNDKNVGWYQNFSQGSAISNGGDGTISLESGYSVYRPATAISNKKYEVTLIYKSLVDVQDLNAIAYDVNNCGYNFTGMEFYFVKDIEIEAGKNISIGQEKNVFRGTLNGNGHKLVYNKKQADNVAERRINPLFATNHGTIENIYVSIEVPMIDFVSTSTAFIVDKNHGMIVGSTIQVNSTYIQDGTTYGINIETKGDLALLAVENTPSGRIENTSIKMKGQIAVEGSYGAIAVKNVGKIDDAVVIYEGTVNADVDIGGAVCINNNEMNNIVVRLFTQKAESKTGSEYNIVTQKDNALYAKNYVGGLVGTNNSLIKNSVIYAWRSNIQGKYRGVVAGTSTNFMANVWAIQLMSDTDNSISLSSDGSDTTKANILIVNGEGIIDATANNGEVKFINGEGNKTIYGWYNFYSKQNIKSDTDKYGNADGDSYLPSSSLGQVVIVVEFVKSSIKNVDDWNDIAKYINSGYSSADIVFKLEGNIVFNPTDDFVPIGTELNPFNYTLNGNNHTITLNSNLAIKKKGTSEFIKNFALFGSLGLNAKITGLNVNISTTQGSISNGVADNDSVAVITTNNYGTIDNVNITLNNAGISGGEVAAYAINNYGDIINSKLTVGEKSAILGVTKSAGVAIRHSGKTIYNVDVSIKGAISAKSSLTGGGASYAAGVVCENNSKIEQVRVVYDKAASSADGTYGVIAQNSNNNASASAFVIDNVGIIKGVTVIDKQTETPAGALKPFISASAGIQSSAVGFIHTNSGEVSSSYIRFNQYALDADANIIELGIAVDESRMSKVDNFWVVTNKMKDGELSENNKTNYYLTENLAGVSKEQMDFLSVELKVKGGSSITTLKEYDVRFTVNFNTQNSGALVFQTESNNIKNGVVDPSYVEYEVVSGKGVAVFTPNKTNAGKVTRASLTSKIGSTDEYYTFVKYVNSCAKVVKIEVTANISTDINVDIANKNYQQLSVNRSDCTISLSSDTYMSDTFKTQVGYSLNILNSGVDEYIPLFGGSKSITIQNLQINLMCNIDGKGVLAESAASFKSLSGITLTVLDGSIKNSKSHIFFDGTPAGTFSKNTIVYDTKLLDKTVENIKNITELSYIAVNGKGELVVKSVPNETSRNTVFSIIDDETLQSEYVGYRDGANAYYGTLSPIAKTNIILDFMSIVVVGESDSIDAHMTLWNELSGLYGANFNADFAKVWLTIDDESLTLTDAQKTRFNLVYLNNFMSGEKDYTPSVISASLQDIMFEFKSYDTVKMTVEGQSEVAITKTEFNSYKFLKSQFVSGKSTVTFKRYTTQIGSVGDWNNIVSETNSGNDYAGQEVSFIADIDLSMASDYKLAQFAGTMNSKSTDGKTFTITLGSDYLVGNLLANGVIENINIKSTNGSISFIEDIAQNSNKINVKVILGDAGIKDGDFIVLKTLSEKDDVNEKYIDSVSGATNFLITYGVTDGVNPIGFKFVKYTYTFNKIASQNDWNLLCDEVDKYSSSYPSKTIKIVSDLTFDTGYKTLGNKGRFAGNISGSDSANKKIILADNPRYLIGSMTGILSDIDIQFNNKTEIKFASDISGSFNNAKIIVNAPTTLTDNSLVFWYNDATGKSSLIEKNTNKLTYVLGSTDKILLGTHIVFSVKVNEIANEKELLLFAKSSSARAYTNNKIKLTANIEMLNYTATNATLEKYTAAELKSLFNGLNGTFDGNGYKISLANYGAEFTMFINNTNAIVNNLVVELPKEGQRADNIINTGTSGTFANVALVRTAGDNSRNSSSTRANETIAGNNSIIILNIDGRGENRYSIGRSKDGSITVTIYPYSKLGSGGIIDCLWTPTQNNNITNTSLGYSDWYHATGMMGDDYKVDAYIYQITAGTTVAAYNFGFADKYLLQAFTGNNSTHLLGLGVYAPGETATFDLKDAKYSALLNYMLDDTSTEITYTAGVINYKIPTSDAKSKKLKFVAIPNASAQIHAYASEEKGRISDADYNGTSKIKIIYEYYVTLADGTLELMTTRPRNAGVYNYRITVYKLGGDGNSVIIGKSNLLQLKINKANIYTNISVDKKVYDANKNANSYKSSVHTYGSDQVLFTNVKFEFDSQNVGKHKIKVISGIIDKTGNNYQIEMDEQGYLMFGGNYVYGEITKKYTNILGDLSKINFIFNATYQEVKNTTTISDIMVGGVNVKLVNNITESALVNENYKVTFDGVEFYAVFVVTNANVLRTAGKYTSTSNDQYIKFMGIPVDSTNYMPITLNTNTAIINVERSKIDLEVTNKTIKQVYGNSEIDKNTLPSVFKILADGVDITDKGIIKLDCYRDTKSSNAVDKYDIVVNIGVFEANNPNYTLVQSSYVAPGAYEIVVRNIRIKRIHNDNRFYSIKSAEPYAICDNDTSGSGVSGYYSLPENATVKVIPVWNDGSVAKNPFSDMDAPIGEYAYRFEVIDKNTKADLTRNYNFTYDSNQYKYTISQSTIMLVKNSVIINSYVDIDKKQANISFNLRQIETNALLVDNSGNARVFSSVVDLPELTSKNELTTTEISVANNSNVMFRGNIQSAVTPGNQVITNITVKIDEVTRSLNNIYRDAIDFNEGNIRQYIKYSFDYLGDIGNIDDIINLVGFELMKDGLPYVIPTSNMLDAGTYSIRLILKISNQLAGAQIVKFSGYTTAVGSSVGVKDENVTISSDHYTMTIIVPDVVKLAPLEIKVDLSASDKTFQYGETLNLDNLNAVIKKASNDDMLTLTQEEKLAMGINIKYTKSVIGDDVKISLVYNKVTRKVMVPDETGKLVEKEEYDYYYATNRNYQLEESNIAPGKVKITTTRLELTVKICGIEVNLNDKSKPIIVRADEDGNYPTFVVEISGANRNGLKNGDKIKSSGGHKLAIKGLADGAMPKENVDYTLDVLKGLKIVGANGRTDVTKNYTSDSLEDIFDGIKINFVGGKSKISIVTLILIIAISLAAIVLIFLIVGIFTRRSKFKKLMVLTVPNITDLDDSNAEYSKANAIDTGSGGEPNGGDVSLVDSPESHIEEDYSKSFVIPTQDETPSFVMDEPMLSADNSVDGDEKTSDGLPNLGNDEDGPIVIESKTKKKTPTKKPKSK